MRLDKAVTCKFPHAGRHVCAHILVFTWIFSNNIGALVHGYEDFIQIACISGLEHTNTKLVFNFDENSLPLKSIFSKQ